MRSTLERETTARASSSSLAMVTVSSSSSSSSSPLLSPKKMKKKCKAVRCRRFLEVPTKLTSPSSKVTSSSLNFTVIVESTAKSEVISDCRSPCCSSNNEMTSNGVLADPEVESAQRSSIHLQCRSEERRKIKEDSTVKVIGQKSTVQIKMPSNDEIEQFFSVAEKTIHKRFADKYNFDVVKDVPLEGRYEWVPIKP